MGSRVAVTAVVIAHNNEAEGIVRIVRDVLPSLRHLAPLIDAELVVVDNSEVSSARLAEVVRRNGDLAGEYVWNGGDNLLYGPSLNLAAGVASSPFLLYACSRHGLMHDPTWAWDLLAPLRDESAAVAMTGSLRPSGSPTAMGFAGGLAPVHVQGGVFAARTAAIRDNPYPGGDYAHWGSDVYQSFQLMQAGYRLMDVPTVNSVWRSSCQPGSWKYVHEGGD